MIKLRLLIIACSIAFNLVAQEKDSLKTQKPKYFRKEEIIHNGKRYRIHNSYLTIGGGYVLSSIRKTAQSARGVDFHFPIRKLHFQTGAMISGQSFSSNNNVQAHLGYGWRKEKNVSNLALYVGPTFFTGVKGDTASSSQFYQGFGAYVSVQAATKFSYDIGIGAEAFAEVSGIQSMIGIKFIAFFSGAYRGPKKNYNPNVRSENSK